MVRDSIRHTQWLEMRDDKTLSVATPPSDPQVMAALSSRAVKPDEQNLWISLASAQVDLGWLTC